MKGNCSTGCKHCIVKDIYEKHELKSENGEVYGVINEFVGYKHYCDKDQDAYDAWHERNKNNTYEVYKNDCIDCFDPDDVTRSLDEMNRLAEEILNSLK